MAEVEKDIRSQKEELFKESQKLFKLRAEQANLIGDISGTLSASRNLQANIAKLAVEKQRQQELIYNANFQIQHMERKVARAQGQRSQEEETKLKGDIKKNSEILEKHKEELKLLVTSNKKLQDERRNIERVIAKINTQEESLKSALQDIIVENDQYAVELNKVTKGKEKTLVQHDCMKLEIKKLRDTVNMEAD